MEKRLFIDLMRNGLHHKHGKFSISDSNNLERVRDILCQVTGEEIVFPIKCKNCNSEFTCDENCKFFDDCKTKNLGDYCVYPTCYQKGLYHD